MGMRKRKPKEDEVECKIMKFKTRTYYITEEDNCAYDIDGDFCGILEDDNKRYSIYIFFLINPLWL